MTMKGLLDMRTTLRPLTQVKQVAYWTVEFKAFVLAVLIVGCGTDVDVGKNALRNDSASEAGGDSDDALQPGSGIPFDLGKTFDQNTVVEIESARLPDDQSCYGSLPQTIEFFCSKKTEYHTLFSEEMALICGAPNSRLTDRFPDFGLGSCGWKGEPGNIDKFYRADPYAMVSFNDPNNPHKKDYWRHFGTYSMILPGTIEKLRDTFFLAVENPEKYKALNFEMPEGTTIEPIHSDPKIPYVSQYRVKKLALTFKARRYGDTGYRGWSTSLSLGNKTLFIFDFSSSEENNIYLRRSAMILHQRTPDEVVMLVTERDHLVNWPFVSSFADQAMVDGDKGRMALLYRTAMTLKKSAGF